LTFEIDPLILPILDRVGTELAEGRYRISSRIGEGSMGHVYRAFDRNLKTEVVIKFPIAPEGSTDPSIFLERFAREARAMIRLSHPHVVKVIDVGEDYGLPYAVMAYLEGGALKDRLVPLEDGEPRPTALESLHGWLMDIAKALDFIHAQGHIHRDVKPANILFDRHGNAFLGDFGVVKSINSPDEIVKGASSTTSPGYLLGTPNYVAPELVMGFPGDGRGDQYALALTVHEALTGWNCMEGPTPSATLVNQTKVEPPKLSSLLRNVPPKLSEAVARGLSKEPSERFESCSSLARAILADVPPLVTGRPLSTPELISPASKGAPGRVPCPACGGLLPVVREHAGRRITCTRCRATAMVQLAAGTVQLLLVDPPPKPPEAEPSKAPAPPIARPNPRVVDLGIEVEAEPISPIDDGLSRRSWIGTSLIGLGLLGVGGLGGWFLGRRRGLEKPVEDISDAPVDPAPIELNIVYGTEKRKWLEAAASEFKATSEGQGIAIHLIGRGSIQGLEEVLNGPGLKPLHVWAPASIANRELLEREWKIRRPGLPGPILKSKNLVLSPMVFVFWKERLDAILEKYGRVDFRTLNQAMHEPGGWGAIAGKPEWGLFRFAHAHPARSNSGLMTLALMAYEYVGKSRDLTLADITRPDFQTWLAKFERGVTRPGGSLIDSTGTLMEEMLARGPSQYDGLILYESLAIDFMKAAEERWGEIRVVYPEPTIMNEHPYSILEVPWSDASHQKAAAAFLDFLMSPPVQIRALKRGFRPGIPSLNAGTPGGPLTKLEKQGFRLKIAPVAEAPPLEVLDDLVAAFRRIEV
jgi:tRNA A-37 threonylcarbamoyl transferase component Bud32